MKSHKWILRYQLDKSDTGYISELFDSSKELESYIKFLRGVDVWRYEIYACISEVHADPVDSEEVN